MAELEAIFFDLGKVLVDFDWRIAIPRFAGLGDGDTERIWRFIQDPLHVEFEFGRVPREQFYQNAVKMMGFRGTSLEFESAWNEIFNEIPATIYCAKELSRLYPLYLLSNTNPLHLEYVEATYDFFQIFGKRFYSCQMGMRKPDAEIYRAVLNEVHAPAERALLIDDRWENLEPARELGMQILHATSPQATVAGLQTWLNTKGTAK